VFVPLQTCQVLPPLKCPFRWFLHPFCPSALRFGRQIFFFSPCGAGMSNYIRASPVPFFFFVLELSTSLCCNPIILLVNKAPPPFFLKIIPRLSCTDSGLFNTRSFFFVPFLPLGPLTPSPIRKKTGPAFLSLSPLETPPPWREWPRPPPPLSKFFYGPPPFARFLIEKAGGSFGFFWQTEAFFAEGKNPLTFFNRFLMFCAFRF